MKIEIVQTSAEQPWHARLKGDNGEPVWTTETYARRADAIHAVALAAETFGVRGAATVAGPPGNTTLVFSRSVPGQPLPTERRFALHDMDERTP